MKAMIIVNPLARSGAAGASTAQRQTEIEQRLTATGPISQIDWVETQHPLHATEFARGASDNGYGCVIAAGGDGTASEVVNGLMQGQTCPMFGLLPWGTSNDFFRALQVAEQTRQDAFTLPLDVARVTFDNLVRYSCLSVSVGLSSWANEQYQNAERHFSRRFAHIPAAITTLLSYHFPSEVQIAIDGGPPQLKPMLFMSISNSPSVAGGVKLTPDAKVDDELFAVCRVAPIPIWDLAYLLLKAQLGLPFRSDAVEVMNVSDLTMTAERPFPVHIDGESVPELNSLTTHLSLHVIPAALHVVLPSLITGEKAIGNVSIRSNK